MSPIVIFAYNRLDELKAMIASLQRCIYADQSDVYIYCDGPKDDIDRLKTEALREYVSGLGGFKSLTVRVSEVNKGLAPSIIAGVSEVINEHGEAIVLEDDLILSSNFLVWMNKCLDFYKDNYQVFSISGSTPRINNHAQYRPDACFTPKAHSWGWATWADRWNKVDWDLTDWQQFSSDSGMQHRFNQLGSEMSGLLFDFKNGVKSSWWVRFCYSQSKLGKLTVYPIISKVANNGFSSEATHCNVYNRYPVEFDRSDKTEFLLPDQAVETKYISDQFFEYYSIKSRILGKLKTYLFKAGFIKQYSIKQ